MVAAQQKRLSGLNKSLSAEEAKEAANQELLRKQAEASKPPVAPVAPEPVVAPVQVVQKPIAGKKFLAQIGLDGGATTLALGYKFSISNENSINPVIGYGIGSNYTNIMANIAFQHEIGTDYIVGGGLDIASYSNRVRGIVGLADIIDKGTAIGAGVEFGRKFGDIIAKIGYSTSLGVTANAGYQF